MLSLNEWQAKLTEECKATFTSEAPLNIYRRNIYGAKLAALASHFAVTKKILGEDVFQQLARAYIERDVDNNDLNLYGEFFSSLLGEYAELDGGLCPPYQPALVSGEVGLTIMEIAAYEYAFQKAYYSGNSMSDFNCLQNAEDAGGCYLIKNPSLSILAMNYDLPVFFESKISQGLLPIKTNETKYFAIFATSDEISVENISATDGDILKAMSKKTISELAETYGDDFNNQLPAWIERRCVIGAINP